MGDGVRGRTVVIAGATSASGRAAVRALRGAGAVAIAVGRDDAKLAGLRDLGARTEVCDLTDEAEVGAFAAALRADGTPVDGILHLVGGWRGGGGLPGQSDADYRALEAGLTAQRHVTRAFWGDLIASDAARVAIVSSTAVARPLAGGANYAAVKAAEEAWARAMAQGFAADARGAHRAPRRHPRSSGCARWRAWRRSSRRRSSASGTGERTRSTTPSSPSARAELLHRTPLSAGRGPVARRPASLEEFGPGGGGPRSATPRARAPAPPN